MRGSTTIENSVSLIGRSELPTEEQVNSQQHFIVDDTLWVDKYRPRRFTDLVGNEKVARDALAWVKQWDYCVFGKTRGKKRIREDENTDQDRYRRPYEKARYVCFRFLAIKLKESSMSDSFIVGASWSRENHLGSCIGSTSGIRRNGN